jgi:hypothetical protein
MGQDLCLDSSIAVLDAAVLVNAAVLNTAVLNAAVFNVPDDAHFALNSTFH